MQFFEMVAARPAYSGMWLGIGVCLGIGASIAADRIEKMIKARKACEEQEDGYEVVLEYDQAPEHEGFEKVITAEGYSKPPITDYTRFFKVEDEEGEIVVAEENDEVSDIPEKVDEPMILISEEEYMDVTLPGYAKADGTFFAADGVLAGWNDKLLVQDPTDTIGLMALDILKEGVDGTVYVRNPELKVDYQITRSDDTYESALDDVEPDI